MSINKEKVIQTTTQLVDKEGLNNISLKVVAENLGIRTPSLYNHIASLDDLLREVAHAGMKEMNSLITQAAIGETGVNAIKSLCCAYFKYMIKHPGVYETIQWATWHGNNETVEIFNNYKSILTKLIYSCNLQKEKTNEILDLLIGVIHGYTTMNLGKAFSKPEETTNELLIAIDTVLVGVVQKYS